MKSVIKAIDKATNGVTSATGLLAAVFLLLIALFVFANVVSRFLGQPLPYLFALTCVSMVIFAFVGASYGLREGVHVRVELLRIHMSDQTNAALDILIYIIALVFFVLLGWFGATWAYGNYIHGVTSTSAVFKFPQWIVVAVIPVGCLLLCVQSLKLMISSIHNLAKAPLGASSSRLTGKPPVVLALVIIALIIGVTLSINVHLLVGLFIILLTVLFAGMPVAFALGAIGCFGIYQLFGSPQFIQLPITAFKQLNSFPLTAAPLFILGGMLMSDAGLAERIFNFVEVWLRRIPSPLLIATVLSGGIFCAITGSSVAATAAMSAICLPILFTRGYNKEHSCGSVAGSTVGTLIPPSAGFILYGIIVDESISRLFMAGVIPAAILFSLYIVFILLRPRFSKEQLEPLPPSTAKEKFEALKSGAWGLLAPIFVLGGIYLGWFTPTEAGGILVAYALFVGVVILRTLKWKELRESILRSTHLSLMILCIISFAAIYGSVISQNQVMAALLGTVEAMNITPQLFLFIVFVILLFLGMFLECVSIMLITLPLTFPVAMALGINPLWFGVFYILNGEIGLLTPPVGLNLFVIKGVSGMPLTSIIRGTLPFLAIMVTTLFIIYFFPQTATWLPSTMH